MTNLATDVFLGTAYINENIAKINSKKSTLNLAGSTFVSIKESISIAAYMTEKAKTNQSNHVHEYNKYPSSSVSQMIAPSMIEVYLHVQSNAQGVELVTLHGKLVRNCKTFVAEGIVDIFSTPPSIIKIAN